MGFTLVLASVRCSLPSARADTLALVSASVARTRACPRLLSGCAACVCSRLLKKYRDSKKIAEAQVATQAEARRAKAKALKLKRQEKQEAFASGAASNAMPTNFPLVEESLFLLNKSTTAKK